MKVKAEVNKLGEPNKLMLSCDVLCALLPAADTACVRSGDYFYHF